MSLKGTAGLAIVAGAVFLLVAAVGAATSYFGAPREMPGPSYAVAHDDTLARLADYTRSIKTDDLAPEAAGDELLPDVNTMIERLAARLETTPEDIKGWRMLGWSYFHTGRYEQAATAYARAVELDPNSAELRASYEEAKAKVSSPDGEKTTKPEATPPRERDAQIQSMVDGLAQRLETSPRDVEGWTRLMRSRVVLGEREVAVSEFRKALEVFKDDAAASGKLTAAAIELGLEAE